MHVCTQLKVMSGLRGWVMVTLKTSADKQVHYTFPSQMKTLHRVMLLILNKWWNNLLSLFVFDANKMEDHKKKTNKKTMIQENKSETSFHLNRNLEPRENKVPPDRILGAEFEVDSLYRNKEEAGSCNGKSVHKTGDFYRQPSLQASPCCR